MENNVINAKEERGSNSSWLKWIIAITVSFAAILEVLDSSIVNVALPDMQGNLGATLSEIGWVVTGYSVANAVVIPLTAWLSDFFGRKRYFIFSLIGFTLASVLCGFATSLPTLVAARILQGLCGGGLLAKAQTILFETFPPEEQGMAQSLFGIGVIVGPVIGPTLGGFLTDTLGWRWIFFINIPFGILAVTMAYLFLPKDSMKAKLNGIDWAGIGLLVMFISSLQTVLEQGQEDDWFSSKLIIVLSTMAIVGFIMFVWQELRKAHPAVNLQVLKHRSLSAGSLYSLVLGMGLYGATFAVPIFAQSVLHYTAMQTGMLMLPGALASALMMPLVGKLSGKVDARILIALGAVGTAASMFIMGSLNPDSSESSLFWPLLLRGASNVFMYLSLSMASIGSLPKADIPAATGIYNLARQMGGSIGVAILTTVLDQRETFHRAILSDNYNMSNSLFRDQLNGLTQTLSTTAINSTQAAHTQALQLLNNTVNLQASVLSFADIFWLVGIMFVLTLPLVLFLNKGNTKTAAFSH